MLIGMLYSEHASIIAAVVCSLIIAGQKLVLTAVIAAGVDLLRHGFFN